MIPKCLLTLVFLLSLAQARADVVLVQDGRPMATIFVDASAGQQAVEAASEFQLCIKRISGAELSITSELSDVKGTRILIGHSDAADRVHPNIPKGFGRSYNDEGYVIVCRDDMLLLAGNETPPYEGTCYAVYDLLERIGCRWYFPGAFGEVIPHKTTIRIPEINTLNRPDFRVRHIWWSGFILGTPEQDREFLLWKRRNRLCSKDFYYNCTKPESVYLESPVDNSVNKLLPKDKYFESHPEYYALNPDGTRNPDVPCMTSEAALAAAAQTICDFFAKNPTCYSYAFSPPDSPILCNCDSCKKAALGGFGGEGGGNMSDVYYPFVDRLSKIIGKWYPDRWLGTMAYWDRFRPAQGVPDAWPNVYIQLADMDNCSLHGYTRKGCRLSAETRAMAERWSEGVGALLFYEYDPFDWGMLHRPVWGSRRIAESYRWLKEHKGWGFNVESQRDVLALGLNHYLRAKLAWNINEPVDALLDDFHAIFFGPAAKPMSSYYKLIENNLWNNHWHLRSGWNRLETALLIWPEDVLSQSQRYLAEAGRLAGDEPYRSRVLAFRASFERLNAACEGYRAAVRGDYAEAAGQSDQMIKMVEEVGDPMLLVDDGNDMYPGWLTGESLKQFYSGYAERLSPEKGRLLTVLPRQAKFRTDPVPNGVIFQWYSPDLDTTEGWRLLRLDENWGSQGVTDPAGSPYTGIGWYRVWVDLPSIDNQERVVLACPGMAAAAAWVWVNGELAGHRTRAEGYDFDLSHLLRPGRNLIAIRVDGNTPKWHPFNRELGGIWLPPIIYSAISQEA